MKALFKIIYWIYFILLGAWLFIAETIIICLLIVLWCSIGYGSWGTRNFGRVWAKLALWIQWCPVEVIGKENFVSKKNACVVVANHQSSFDIYVLYAHIDMPFKWVLKESLRRMLFVGWACEASGFIFVDNTKKSSIVDTMTSAKKALKEGYSVFIFPEGTRTLTGKLGRFKKGAFAMASELDVDVLPVTIDGAYDVLKKGDFLPMPGKIKMTIHPSMKTSDYGHEPADLIRFGEAVKEQIASALPEENR